MLNAHTQENPTQGMPRWRNQQALTATPDPSWTWLTHSEFKGNPPFVMPFLARPCGSPVIEGTHLGRSLVWALLRGKRGPLLH